MFHFLFLTVCLKQLKKRGTKSKKYCGNGGNIQSNSKGGVLCFIGVAEKYVKLVLNVDTDGNSAVKWADGFRLGVKMQEEG